MRIANINDWKSDAALCEKGAPLDLGNGRTLYVRRYGHRNRAFMAEVAQLPEGKGSDESDLIPIYARSLVVDWEGFLDDDGMTVPYSAEECIELFTQAPEIFDAVVVFSAQRANFQTKEQKEERDSVKS